MKNKFILFSVFILIISGLFLSVQANNEFTKEDITYFNNLKNCTPTYIKEDGITRQITGVINGACVFKEHIPGNSATGMPEINLSCSIPKAQLSVMINDLLKALSAGGTMSETAKLQYQQMIQSNCDIQIQQ